MIDFQNFLTEGVYDKHIFKAFFLAGGPGSGKSWVAKRTLGGTGMKVINSDAGFKRYAKKAKLDLERMDKFNDDETRLKNKLRERSKRGTLTQLEYAISKPQIGTLWTPKSTPFPHQSTLVTLRFCNQASWI